MSYKIQVADCSSGRSSEKKGQDVLLEADSVIRKTKEGEKYRDPGETGKECGKVDRQLKRWRKRKDGKVLRHRSQKNVTFAEPLIVNVHEYQEAVYEDDEDTCRSELLSTTPRSGKGMSDEGMALRTGHLDVSDDDCEGVHADPLVAVLPIPSRRVITSMIDQWEKKEEEDHDREDDDSDSITDSDDSSVTEDEASDNELADSKGVGDEQKQWTLPDGQQSEASVPHVDVSGGEPLALPYMDFSALASSPLPNENDTSPCHAQRVEGNAPRNCGKPQLTFAALLGDDNPLLFLESQLRSIDQALSPQDEASCSARLSQLSVPEYSSGHESAVLYDEPPNSTCHDTSSDWRNVKKEDSPPFLSLRISPSNLILNDEKPCCLLFNGELCEGDNTNTSKSSLATLSSTPSSTPMPVPNFRTCKYGVRTPNFSALEIPSGTTNTSASPLSSSVSTPPPSRTFSERSQQRI
eukprot:GHVS01051509.1.p1 GENE.GHVS01051509.1~~GHVS01051509.1.p1  ORF type:complete len:466 (+),score=47.19 GHVS01051509.1:183-1580(+)